MDNAALTMFAGYDGKTPDKLEFVGDEIQNVKFSASGTSGYYSIIRVK